MLMKKLLQAAALLAVTLTTTALPSAAQVYSKVYVFGDSTVDSGYYRALASPQGGTTFNSLWPAAVANGAGVPTSRPGLMNSELLASYFGATAAPSNTSGGTNFAASGAKNADVNTTVNGGFQAAIATVTQIANYLAANGNAASPTALYYISSGGNDISFATGATGTGPFPADPNAYVVSRAQSLATAIASLKTAGAQTIVVNALAASFPTTDTVAQTLKAAYNTALFNQLASLGVTVIKSDFNATRLAMVANPANFGLTSTGTGSASSIGCTQPAGVTTAWALLCSTTAGAPSQLFAANGDMIRLFADNEHFGTAGQKLLANYIYSLLPAATSSPLFSAVLPVSRSVQVGSAATAFATIINSGPSALTGCQFSPTTNVFGRFTYQVTNASNQLTGTPNTPASIPAGGAQSFLLAFQTTAAMPSTDVSFAYVCTNTAAAVPIVGINTIKLVFDTNPVADMITVGLTPSNDGFARTGGTSGSGLFVIASVNIGVSTSLTARTRITGTNTPLAATICQTDANNGGACLSTPTTTVTTTIANNQITTWGAFLQASGTIAADPAQFRVFFEFVDAGGIVRGSTSTAVTTVAAGTTTQ